MSGVMPTEKKFEDFIEDNLLKIKDTNAPNYKSLHFNSYNRKLCLIEMKSLISSKRHILKNGKN